MSDEDRTVRISADVGDLLAAWRQVATVEQQAAASLLDGLTKAEAATGQVASAQLQVARQREAEADILAHQAQLLKASGAAQSQVLALQRQALGLRREAALAVGDEAEAVALLRQQAIAAAKATTAEKAEAAKVELDAAKRIEAEQRQAAKAEAEAVRAIDAAKRESAKAELAAIRAAEVARRQAGAEALAIERKHLALWREQEQAARELAEVERKAHTDKLAAFDDAVGRSQVLGENLRSQADRQREINGDAGRYRQIQADLGDGAARVAEGWDSAAKRVKPFGAALLDVGSSIGNVVSGIESLVNLAKMGIELVNEAADTAYETQAVSHNMQIDISGARSEMQGLVSDYDLAAIANRAFSMGVVSTGDEFAEMVGLVSVRARQLGLDQTQLLNDFTSGVAKQESEILDNLGIVLRLTDAYEIYGKSIGKAAKDLSADDKAVAYRMAAMSELTRVTKGGLDINMRLSEAYDRHAQSLGKSAAELTEIEKVTAIQSASMAKLAEETQASTAATDDWASSWKKARVTVENAKRGIYGFDDTMGRVREALRELSEEDLSQLEFAAAIDDNSAAAAKYVKMLEKWDLSLTDLRKAATELDGATGDLREDWGRMFDIEMAGRAEDALAQKREAATAVLAEQVETLTLQADETGHINDLMDAQGQSARMNLLRQIEELEVRREAARLQALITKSTADEAKLLAITRKLEIANAKLANLKGKGKGPSAAEKLKAQLAEEIKAREDALELAEVTAEIYGRTDARALEFSQRRHDLAVAELENERKVLEITKAKTSVERTRIEGRLAGIEREIHLLEERQRLEAVSVQRELDKADAEERIAFLDREIERNRALGVSVQLLERQRDAEAEAAAELYGSREDWLSELHSQEMRAIEEARAARVEAAAEQLRIFDREAELADLRGDFVEAENTRRLELQLQVAQAEGDLDAQRELHHQREIARLQDQQAARERMLATVEQNIATFQGFQSSFTDLQGFFTERQAAAEDAQLAHTIESMNAQAKAQHDALQKRIDAAQGNARLQEQLRKQQAANDARAAKAAERAQAEHNDKRKREDMRRAGFELIITGVVETVRAIASFASFNFVEGALHTAAAAVAYAQGGALLSGKIPGGGAAAAMSSGGGGGGYSSADASGGGGSSSSSSSAPAVPPSAEELLRIRGGYGADDETGKAEGPTTTINAGVIVTSDSGHMLGQVDTENRRKWG